ncbi:hypothetical protein B296_00022720 [Ensete ventricosum]|uniref:PHD-type domain-containing protein n=1 Tax=Ensete ventricosum TaxID=4639 RepID=A0A426YT84_ENSVE|nr:hypothetical protein B296_00022720 [Ensete ventricosum]
MAIDLPCDGDGICMVCKAAPPEAEMVHCCTCASPWHAQCLSKPPESMAVVARWQCPDCDAPEEGFASAPAAAPSGGHAELIAGIRAIEADGLLTEAEKARRRQALLGGGVAAAQVDDEEESKKKKGKASDDVLDLLDEKFNCSFCMQLPERPVTEEHGWKWMKPPPISRKPVLCGDERKSAKRAVKHAQNMSVRERLLKGLQISESVAYILVSFIVNRELMDLIESLQNKTAEEQQSEESSDIVEKSSGDESDALEERFPNEGGSNNVEKEKATGSAEGKDNVEENNLESIDGDSDVNVVANSESEEGGLRNASPVDVASGTNSQSSRKRKNAGSRSGVKKAQNEEATAMCSEHLNAEKDDAAGKVKVDNLYSETEQDGKEHVPDQVSGAKGFASCKQNNPAPKRARKGK